MARKNSDRKRRKKAAEKSKPNLKAKPSAANKQSRAAGQPDTARSVFPDIPHLNLLATLALCALVAVCFFPATEAGFVWDDEVLQ